jgi:peptidoglycan/LPS O-acetylase OafA/YrhL
VRDILNHRLPDWAPSLWLVMVGTGVLLFVGHWRKLWRGHDFQAAPTIIIMALTFIVMFVAQGMLSHPSRQYAYPIGGFVLLIFGVGLELFGRIFMQEIKKIYHRENPSDNHNSKA